jgi:hypothetical protein
MEEATDVRAVVVSSSLPKLFSAGIDCMFTKISAFESDSFKIYL